MLELELDREAATLELARSLADVIEGGDVIGLEGGLGAGKTTFVRGAVHGLGVSTKTPVTSPTFALLQHYEGRLPVVHADFYRLGDDAELAELGIDELLEEGSVVFVEWGRKFPGIARETDLWVELEILSDHARRARLHPQSSRGEVILDALSKRLHR